MTYDEDKRAQNWVSNFLKIFLGLMLFRWLVNTIFRFWWVWVFFAALAYVKYYWVDRTPEVHRAEVNYSIGGIRLSDGAGGVVFFNGADTEAYKVSLVCTTPSGTHVTNFHPDAVPPRASVNFRVPAGVRANDCRPAYTLDRGDVIRQETGRRNYMESRFAGEATATTRERTYNSYTVSTEFVVTGYATPLFKAATLGVNYKCDYLIDGLIMQVGNFVPLKAEQNQRVSFSDNIRIPRRGVSNVICRVTEVR